MTTKILLSGAIQADVDIANAVEIPTHGCDAGSGIHIIIPADWQAQIAAGNDVPGCTYSKMAADGSLTVSTRVQAQILISAIVNLLTVPLQLEVPLLIVKLAAA